MLNKKIIFYITSLMAAGYIAPSYSSLTCSTAANGTANALLQGVPTASVTQDLPVGTIIFKGRFTQGDRDQVFLDCKRDDPGSTQTDKVETKTYAIVKNGKLSGIDDYTYQTNIPGIGVRYWIYSDYIKSTERDISPHQVNQKFDVPPGGSAKRHLENIREMTFWLVKTGPVSAGSVNGASFPAVEYSVKSVGPAVMKGLPNVFQKFTFSGTYPITVPSCQTPNNVNVNVNLGSFTSTSFDSVPDTKWTDASIRLTNCGTFTGYQPDSAGDSQWVQPKATGNYNVANTNIKPYTNNLLGITLNSNQKNIDLNKGIVGIKTGAGEAQGVAVQLAKGSPGSNTPLVLAREFTQTLSKSGVATVDIPLVVRLTKQGTVSAGRVNAQITYTINYR